MTLNFTRRAAVSLIAGGALAPFAPARAARVLDLHAGGGFQPINVAVTSFVGDDAARTVTSVVNNNFKRSVFLKPVDGSSVAGGEVANPDQTPNLNAFRAINAQFVLTGRSQRGGDGRLKTDFRLFDVTTGEQAAGSQFVTDTANARRVAHLVSDAVFTRITGEKGFFDTRVVFVDESGTKDRRRKRLAIMDQDGANVRYLTRGDELVVTPRFSPSSQDVTYMAMSDEGDPKVFLINVESGQREAVGNFPGIRASRPTDKRSSCRCRKAPRPIFTRWSYARARRRGSPTRRPSTPRPAIRRTGVRLCSNPTAAARSRSM